MGTQWLWTMALTISTSVLTVLITQGLQKFGSKLKAARDERTKLSLYAFRFSLRFANTWYLEKLSAPPAENFSYRVIDSNGNERPRSFNSTVIEPGVSYGFCGIEARDTIEIWWTESGRQHSTFQILHDEREDYHLRRENIGH